MSMCPIPWKFQAIRNNGDVRLCCQANVTQNQGIVQKENGEAFNAARDSLTEAWQSDLLKTVRKNMIEGKWSDECGRCRLEEESGVRSRRLNELDMWDWDRDKALQHTDDDGNTDLIPVYYDLRFGNLCNLSCRMCGPTDSHQWYQEWIDFHNDGNGFYDTHGRVNLIKDKKGRFFTNDYDWHKRESFWNQIEKIIPNLEHVYMAGGEPLMIERHYDFLKKCIDSNSAKNIVLEYNTNLTNMSDRVINDFWPHFKEVRIGASIDGMGAVQEYQRYPSKWNQIHQNLKKLNSLCKDNKNIISWIAYTITVYNVFHLPEFMWWKVNSDLSYINKSKTKPILTPHLQHQPYRTNIQVLPMEIKRDLENHFKTWNEKFQNSNLDDHIKLQAAHIFDSTIAYLFAEDRSKDLNEFISFTKFLDHTRNQNISNVIPELGKLFD